MTGGWGGQASGVHTNPSCGLSLQTAKGLPSKHVQVQGAFCADAAQAIIANPAHIPHSSFAIAPI
ncbi:MAG: hypothetical protein K2P94_18455 [Rhodospirillaceae bacterium]|nr:hypothetical protein [Rhodospirillaceae bacterium]